MRKPLAALGILLAVLALAVVLMPYWLPQPYLQRQLGRLLANETGLYLEEAQRLRLSVFPQLGIAVEGVSVMLPLGASSGPSIRADRIFTAIRPSSLFGQRLEVSKVTIENPSMLFHIDASGRSNWDLTALWPFTAPVRLAALGDSTQIAKVATDILPPQGERRALPSVDIDIVNGSFAYRDDVRRRVVQIEKFDLSLRSPGANGRVTLEGGLLLQGQKVRLSATATPPDPPSDRSAALRFALASDAMRTDLDGVLLWRGRPHFAGTSRVKFSSGEALARWTGGNAQALSRFDGAELAGRLELSDQELVISDGKLSAPGASGDFSAFADFDGTTRISLDNLALHGGTGQGKLTLDARQPEPVLAGSFQMAGVDGLSLSKGLSRFDWLSGRTDLAIDVAGGGRSLDAIAGTLTGKARLTVANGAIEGIDLPLIVAKAKEGEIGKWRREAGRRTPFDRFDASYAIEKGIASTSDITLSGPNIAASGEGRTDLTQGKLDYKLKTKVTAHGGEASSPPPAEATPAEGGPQEQASLAIPLIVKGDWDKPDIYPDLANALKDKDGLVGTAKLFGKSVEKLTDGKIKADEFGKALDSLFGKKKKKKDAE
ncbi:MULTISPECIES: AsmA family protein [Rhodomicrobium]|uniref:AsmA family protein n=1 Tax=Rhodomicrobium TaxID=1068 RepID=UPI00148282EE|nr:MULTISPECIES: AsmA family protein [Rhodomicrobium]